MEIIPVNVSERKYIATQANKLIESRYFLTVGEQKVMLLLISMIAPNDTDFKDYEMKVSDFAKVMGLSGNSVYERLNESLDKLLSRVIHIPKETGFLKIGWVSSAEYVEGTGKILLSFDKKLKPYLLGLKEQFTKYKLFIVTQFRSAYTIRIYMLLKQYETIGYREFDIYEFREILGIDENLYPDFKRFRPRVLNQAKKEFEKKDKNTGAYQSDITFDLETIRTGRKITRLRFIIKKQAYQEALPLDLPEPEEKAATPAIQSLMDHGISEAMASDFIEAQGESAILRCVELYEINLKAGKVKEQGGGYLLSMLNAGAGKQTKAEKEQEKKQKDSATQKAKLAQEKHELEQRQTSYENAKNETITGFLDNLDTLALRDIKAQFEASELFETQIRSIGFTFGKYKEDGIESPMIASFYRRFLTETYLPEEYKTFDSWLAYEKNNKS